LSHGFEIGCAIQGVSTAEEECNQVACHVSAGDVKAAGEVVENNGFIDRDNVSYSVTRVNYNS
jgi:hypothetical protein